MEKPASSPESAPSGPYSYKTTRTSTFKVAPIEFTSTTVTETTSSHPPPPCNCHDKSLSIEDIVQSIASAASVVGTKLPDLSNLTSDTEPSAQ